MRIYWLSVRLVKAIHQEQIAEHGGSNGLRDEGLLESAITRPENLYGYNQISDIPRLGAAYTFGIVKNHPFIDGNKRTGFVSGVTFLLLNGYQFKHSEIEVVNVMQKLAAGTLNEDNLQLWFLAGSKIKTK
jgi:death-on-curing protein